MPRSTISERTMPTVLSSVAILSHLDEGDINARTRDVFPICNHGESKKHDEMSAKQIKLNADKLEHIAYSAFSYSEKTNTMSGDFVFAQQV